MIRIGIAKDIAERPGPKDDPRSTSDALRTVEPTRSRMPAPKGRRPAWAFGGYRHLRAIFTQRPTLFTPIPRPSKSPRRHLLGDEEEAVRGLRAEVAKGSPLLSGVAQRSRVAGSREKFRRFRRKLGSPNVAYGFCLAVCRWRCDARRRKDPGDRLRGRPTSSGGRAERRGRGVPLSKFLWPCVGSDDMQRVPRGVRQHQPDGPEMDRAGPARTTTTE